jgi:hypothetical protein
VHKFGKNSLLLNRNFVVEPWSSIDAYCIEVTNFLRKILAILGILVLKLRIIQDHTNDYNYLRNYRKICVHKVD